jgi:hypothetical protein
MIVNGQFRQDKLAVISKGYYLDKNRPVCQEIKSRWHFDFMHTGGKYHASFFCILNI